MPARKGRCQKVVCCIPSRRFLITTLVAKSASGTACGSTGGCPKLRNITRQAVHNVTQWSSFEEGEQVLPSIYPFGVRNSVPRNVMLRTLVLGERSIPAVRRCPLSVHGPAAHPRRSKSPLSSPPRKRGSTSVQKELDSHLRGNDRQEVIFDAPKKATAEILRCPKSEAPQDDRRRARVLRTTDGGRGRCPHNTPRHQSYDFGFMRA
jgi:hypothetical protein